jgi:hypothetical protein
MAGKERRGDHQKLKMLYLAKIFSEETDDQHARAIIVTSTTVSEEDSPMRRRADELNIEVIEWNELPLQHLVNRLRMRPVG